jgi:lysophospholipase L1-like esterase
LSRSVGARQRVFVVAVAAALIVELVTASAFALTAHREAPRASPMSIAVIGDSYTAGIQNQVVWPTLLAQRTGWSVSNFALPNAGFVADGLGGHAFTYQVDRAQAANPRVILIVGGLADDELPDTEPVTVAAIDVINKIKVGGQRALVVGPTWYETPVPGSVKGVSNAIRNVAEKAEVPYLDALDPPWLTRDLMQPDLSGPTDDGQSVIADKIAAWLRTEVAG